MNSNAKSPETLKNNYQEPAKEDVLICRCQEVTESEIVAAIRDGATTVDGVKRRTRAGMGRCQAGFCTSRTMEILSRETGIPMETICKNSGGSEMLSHKM